MPPPYLEIHWRNSTNGSFDEMDMEDMFDADGGTLIYIFVLSHVYSIYSKEC